MDKSLTENANHLQKLVSEQGSGHPAEPTHDEASTESRPGTDHQHDNTKDLHTINQRDNTKPLQNRNQETTIRLGIPDYQDDIPMQLPHQRHLPKSLNSLNDSHNNPRAFKVTGQQDNNESFKLPCPQNNNATFTQTLVHKQRYPDLTHRGLQERFQDIEEDADPCLSVSDQPERQPTYPERQPTVSERRSRNTECQPTYPERQPTYPECQPTVSDRPLMGPKRPDSEPPDTDRRSRNTECRTTHSGCKPTNQERQPTDSEHQHTNPERQPTSSEHQQTHPERQPQENTESLGGYLGAGRLAAEQSEDEDERYRRMMSQELAKQWRDEPEACESTWSPGSSVIESGYSEGRSIRSCRKCDLAKNMFLCPETRMFWTKVTGNMCCKRIWKDFYDELKREFPEESALSKRRVLDMFRCLLGVQHQELNEVTIENYLKFIRFFGPFRQERNRCVAICQLEYLVENSSQPSKKKRSKICWFGGYMTRQEAEEKLEGQEPGTFLVRMSDRGGMEGSFVVSLVMKDRQPDHFQIKGSPEEAVSTHPFSQELEFKGQQFSSLPDLVNSCLRVTTICDTDNPMNGVVCRTVCPNLPFNYIMSGYKIA